MAKSRAKLVALTVAAFVWVSPALAAKNDGPALRSSSPTSSSSWGGPTPTQYQAAIDSARRIEAGFPGTTHPGVDRLIAQLLSLCPTCH